MALRVISVGWVRVRCVLGGDFTGLRLGLLAYD